MKRYAHALLVLAAALLGGLAVVLLIAVDRWWVVLPSLCLHAAGVVVSLVTARRRRGGPLSPVERDATILFAAVAPFFGPALAWTFVRTPDESEAEDNAHEVFERYLEHVKPAPPEHERTLFTGDFEKDLARELDVDSFAQVLRDGELDQRHSAIRRLATLGRPRHLTLVRKCLVDPDQEIQLYAYSELERVSKGYETSIYECMAQLDETARDVEAVRNLARAHFEYGRCGALDEAASRFHLRMAVEQAEVAIGLADSEPDAAVILALCHAELGDMEAATAAIERVPDEHVTAPKVRVARAELAYLTRDFDTARAEAETLVGQDVCVPEWIGAFVRNPERLRTVARSETTEESDDPGEGDAEGAPVSSDVPVSPPVAVSSNVAVETAP